MNVAFIVGCARSGTSILGELVASHPEIEYIFEPHHVWELGGLGPNDSHRLTSEHATPEVQAQIRHWFESQQKRGGYIVDKTPRNALRVSYLRALFPEGKIIHIIRDGRDVACSMMPGIGGEEWGHLKPPSWKSLMLNQTGIVRCAMAWKEIVEIALEELRTVPHLEVRYEELVRSPDTVAEDVFRFLDLPIAPETRDFCKRIQNSTEGSYHAKNQVVWYREDHKTRVGRWKENIDQTQQQRVTEELGSLLSKLGYDL